MKKFTFLFALMIASLGLYAQETKVELSLQPGYSQNVYFDFASGQAEGFDVAAWDIAFLRTSSYEFAERINDGLGIEVYEASDDPDDYATINPDDIDQWTQLYNSDTIWQLGAFDLASATYGWGEYNPANHHVSGTTVYVLKYKDGSFRKFMIDDFFAGYTFRYATWNAANTAWENEQVVTLSNSENAGKLFNFYSLTDNRSVVASPDLAKWDLVFQTYMTDLGIMYPVIGALQSPNVKVAKSTDEDVNAIDETAYSEKINTVGYDWKKFEGGAYLVDSDTYYFLKRADGKIFRFRFLSYSGSSTGNFSLGYEDVTGQTNSVNFDERNSLSIYPNPVTSNFINILYEAHDVQTTQVEIYDIAGKLMLKKQLPTNGFFNQQIDLTNMTKGVYILKFKSGKYTDTQKIIIE